MTTLHYGRRPVERKGTLASWLEAEFVRMKGPHPGKPFVAVTDGTEEDWRIVGELSLKVGLNTRWVLDFYHLMEHVGAAGSAFHGLGAERARVQELQRWHDDLQQSTNVRRRLPTHLAELAAQAPDKNTRKPIEKELAYVKNQHRRKRLRYRWLRRRHLPIGSGVQEAACKTLVAQRLKLTGQRLEHRGGQAILSLRRLSQSDRMAAAFSALRQRALVKPFAVDPEPGRKRPHITPC